MFYGIHGVADGEFGGLNAARFAVLAERTLCYPGAVAAAYQAQQAADAERAHTPGGSTEPAQPLPEATVDELAAQALPMDVA